MCLLYYFFCEFANTFGMILTFRSAWFRVFVRHDFLRRYF